MNIVFQFFQVAQYINFTSQVLETFVKKFYEEEDREVDRIKEKWDLFHDQIVQSIFVWASNKVLSSL